MSYDQEKSPAWLPADQLAEAFNGVFRNVPVCPAGPATKATMAPSSRLHLQRIRPQRAPRRHLNCR
ncbi:hypothetical protein ABZU22_24280 [Micromonospora sp. NPDC005222]|uniref:hypothetical protein n=1 Tax=unclassified Micromonospora TaxID=2617518 RepID=UPI0033ABB1AF